MTDCKIICGDCLEVLPQLEDGLFACAIVDAPYGSGGRDGSVHLNNPAMIGNRMGRDAHLWLTREYGKLLFAKTKADAHCYAFTDWRKFIDLRISYESAGWECRALIVWDKGNGMGEYWRSSHEFILFLTKRQPRPLTHGGCFNVLRFPPARANKLHPAQKPVALIEYLIEASTQDGEAVIDPFCGSGSTAGLP